MTGAARDLIVGVALDVSGSMSSSLQNRQGGRLSRLDSIREALDAVLAEATKLVSHERGPAATSTVSFFGYVFGLRIPGAEVADLFRRLEVYGELHRFTSQAGALRALTEERTLTLECQRDQWDTPAESVGAITVRRDTV